jgi:hypothetical protein
MDETLRSAVISPQRQLVIDVMNVRQLSIATRSTTTFATSGALHRS